MEFIFQGKIVFPILHYISAQYGVQQFNVS